MIEFNWEAFSQEFKDKYNKIRSDPRIGANVRPLTELMFLCIEEANRLQVDDSEPEPPVKRRGRPPKPKDTD